MIDPEERRRRENAVRQAYASVGLEGFTIPPAELERARRFVDGEIDLDEFVEPSSNRKSDPIFA